MPRPNYGGQVLRAELAGMYRRAGHPNPHIAGYQHERVRANRNVKPNPSYGGHQLPTITTRRSPFNFLPLDGL